MIPEFEAECQKFAADQALSLPAQFSAQKLFSDIGQVEFNKPVLDAAAVLRRHGMLLLFCEVLDKPFIFIFFCWIVDLSLKKIVHPKTKIN